MRAAARRNLHRLLLAGWRRRASWDFGGSVTRSSDAGLVIGIIDDPELSMRLLSVRGRVTASSFEAVARALDEIRDHDMLHLDMTDAAFSDQVVVRAVGRLLDELEDRQVRIRIVGLDALLSGPVD
jgi:hypothetical protein